MKTDCGKEPSGIDSDSAVVDELPSKDKNEGADVAQLGSYNRGAGTGSDLLKLKERRDRIYISYLKTVDCGQLDKAQAEQLKTEVWRILRNFADAEAEYVCEYAKSNSKQDVDAEPTIIDDAGSKVREQPTECERSPQTSQTTKTR